MFVINISVTLVTLKVIFFSVKCIKATAYATPVVMSAVKLSNLSSKPESKF